MNDHRLAEDAHARTRALSIESFIVEAPAGAGKTELLTQRYLRLLATVESPEEVVAITFTRKAAAEMRERIVAALRTAAGGVRPEAPHKQVTFELARAALAHGATHDWDMLAQPGRLRLTTIDALCAALARQMPLLSRFGSQPGIIDDARHAYAEAARRTLAHLEDDASDPHAEAVATVLDYLDNDAERLMRLLARMLARRDQWRPLAGLDDPQQAIEAVLREIVEAMLHKTSDACNTAWQQQIMPLARFAADNLGGGALADWQTPLPADADALAQWQALADLVLTQGDTVRKQVDKRQGFPADKAVRAQKEAMTELLAAMNAQQAEALAEVRRLPAHNAVDAAVVQALVSLLTLAAAELWLVFRDAGEVDFVELAARALTALGSAGAPSDLALHLDYRIRHLLVDEFQDTSPTQVELLERLTAGWQADDGRTLFVVGDPMQSIYRFRAADVGLFLRAARQGIGGVTLTPLRLWRNNRSHGPVVAWINETFPAIFPTADEPFRGEIKYRECLATRDDAPGAGDAGVRVHVVTGGKVTDVAAAAAMDATMDATDTEVGDDDLTTHEAQKVIELIAAEWRADPTRQIAVLARARRHLGPIITAIRQHPDAWRFTGVDIEPLAERPWVADVLSLTRALHHRGDRLHWLAVLRAPWCGLRLADLHVLAADDHRATIWSLMHDTERIARLSADGAERLAHVRSALGEALAGQGRQSRRRWIEDAWRCLGGDGLVDANGLADVMACLARIEALDSAGRFALDDLDKAMDDLYSPPDAGADGRLQLMTIHKSKGLEFDTVIVPGMGQSVRPDDAELLLWDSFATEHGERLVVAPMNRRGHADGPTAYDFLRRMEAARSANEAARVLYVGATRAIRRLHWVASLKPARDGAEWKPAGGSPLARLWPVVGDAVLAELAPPVARNPAASAAPAPVAASASPPAPGRLLRTVQLPLPAPPAPVSAPLVDDDDTGNSLAAAIGTLVHACLEQIAGHTDAWPVAGLPARAPGFARWMTARGWADNDAQTAAQAAVKLLATTLQSEAGRWVLAAHADAAAELALANYSGGDTAPIRVVDRTFVADGVRWIIDYKTAQVADPSRLAAHAERYRAQLAGYAALFADAGLPVRSAVLFVAHGVLVAFD